MNFLAPREGDRFMYRGLEHVVVNALPESVHVERVSTGHRVVLAWIDWFMLVSHFSEKVDIDLYEAAESVGQATALEGAVDALRVVLSAMDGTAREGR